jgi:hypothetical protein
MSERHCRPGRILTRSKGVRFPTRDWKTPQHLRTHSPLLLFLFSTADDQGFFSWILRPQQGKLEWVSALEMSKITRKSLDAIFETAERWNRTLTETLAKGVKTGLWKVGDENGWVE